MKQKTKQEDELTYNEKEKVTELKSRFEGIADDFIYEEKLPKLDGTYDDNIGKATTEEKMLQFTAQKMLVMKNEYEKFAEEYPRLAEYGLTVLNVGLQSLLVGPAGFFNAARGELMAGAIGAAFCEKIAYGIDYTLEFGADELQARHPNLAREEAKVLTAGSILTAMGVAEGSQGMKAVLNHLKIEKIGPNFPRNSQYAGKTYHADDLPDSIKTAIQRLKTNILMALSLMKKGFLILPLI